MQGLRHQHQKLLVEYFGNDVKQGHPCQPMIKNYIFNCERTDIKLFLNVLESIKNLTNIIGEDNIKNLLFLISQDTASSANIYQCANIYKKERNLNEYNLNTKKMKKTKIKRNVTIS
tara:strand:- start:109 stop:459 length:351 start_codon:yes stop_codon:yes gene_type:complete